MNRVPSLTEYTLLHRWALDLLSPSDFQKLPIPNAGDSVLETIQNSTKNTHSNLKNTSWLHSADKYYLLTPLQAIYAAAVTLIISRVGVVYHTVMTSFYYLKCRVSNDSETIENSWKKVKEHACAIVVDGLCAVIGALSAKFAVDYCMSSLYFTLRFSHETGSHETGVDQLKKLAMFSAMTALLMGGLASLQSARVAPEFFAFLLPDHKVGMYLSLFFRKKLGLVGPDGGLLPFSAKDKLEYQESKQGISFSCHNTQTLHTQIYNAELELIEAVQASNKLLPEESHISFQYPLDGDAIARKLEELYAKKEANARMALMPDDKRPILLKVDEIRALQLRIKYSKEIYDTARELTYNDGYIMQPLKRRGRHPVKSLNLKPMVSSIPEREYRDYFASFNPPPSRSKSSRAGFDSAPRGHANNAHANNARFNPSSSRSNPSSSSGFGQSSGASAEFSWHSVKIDPIDPNTPRPRGGIDAQFSYDVAVNKWKAENNRTNFKTPRELLGLTPDATYNSYKQAKRRYALACHPDKHGSNPAAMEIQKCLNAILEKLDKEFKA